MRPGKYWPPAAERAASQRVQTGVQSASRRPCPVLHPAPSSPPPMQGRLSTAAEEGSHAPAPDQPVFPSHRFPRAPRQNAGTCPGSRRRNRGEAAAPEQVKDSRGPSFGISARNPPLMGHRLEASPAAGRRRPGAGSLPSAGRPSAPDPGLRHSPIRMLRAPEGGCLRGPSPSLAIQRLRSTSRPGGPQLDDQGLRRKPTRSSRVSTRLRGAQAGRGRDVRLPGAGPARSAQEAGPPARPRSVLRCDWKPDPRRPSPRPAPSPPRAGAPVGARAPSPSRRSPSSGGGGLPSRPRSQLPALQQRPPVAFDSSGLPLSPLHIHLVQREMNVSLGLQVNFGGPLFLNDTVMVCFPGRAVVLLNVFKRS